MNIPSCVSLLLNTETMQEPILLRFSGFFVRCLGMGGVWGDDDVHVGPSFSETASDQPVVE